MVKFFLTLFYIRLPSNIKYFTVTHLNQARILNKVHCINAVNRFFPQSSMNISLSNILLLANILKSCGYYYSRLFLNKDNFHVHVRQGWHLTFLLFEDMGRLHVYHNKSKIDHCWGNPFQACLSEIAIDRDWLRFRHNRLGLFICWIGHNYPVPSSPPHAPRSETHWPNGME